jgi:hypothetical protein
LGWLDPHLNLRLSLDPDPDRTHARPDFCIHDTKDGTETNQDYVKERIKVKFYLCILEKLIGHLCAHRMFAKVSLICSAVTVSKPAL